MNPKSNPRITTSAALILLAFNLSYLVWYLFVGYEDTFHSDSATKVLLAREIVATGNYFPRDWNYVNGDLFVFFGHTFIIPLLAFIPAGFSAHAISGLIFSLLILVGVWLVSGMSSLSTCSRLIVLAIAASGISPWMSENLYGQVSYGMVVFFYLYLIYFWKKFTKTEGVKATIWGIGIFTLMLLLFWANPQRALIFFGIPFICAVFWQLHTQIYQRRQNGLCLLIVIAGFIIGSALHLSTLSHVNNLLEVAGARWLDYEAMIENALVVPQGVFAIFGGLPTPKMTITSVSGVYEAFRLVAALFLIVLIPKSLSRTTLSNKNLSFIGVFTATSGLLILVLFITTTIPTTSDPIASSRYLIPPLFLGLLIVFMTPIDWKLHPITSLAIVLSATALLTSPPALLLQSNSEPSKHAQLVEFLEKNHLNYGYATYWHAGVLSVLSDENSLVRQIAIDNGMPMPKRHLSSNNWYRPSAWQGDTFLILSDSELNLIDWNRLAYFDVRPSKRYKTNEFNIFVFDRNIAELLPGWDSKYERAASFPASKYSLSLVGQLSGRADDNSQTLIAQKGESGALHFGPYVYVEPGQYVVTFDVLAKHDSAGAVRLEVVGGPDLKVYGERVLSESKKPQEIVVTFNEAQTIQFRVIALGNEQVSFKGVKIQRLKTNG